MRDVFAGCFARSALPGMRAAIAGWRPDVVLREAQEYASSLAAEEAGVPEARVGVMLEHTESFCHRRRRAGARAPARRPRPAVRPGRRPPRRRALPDAGHGGTRGPELPRVAGCRRYREADGPSRAAAGAVGRGAERPAAGLRLLRLRRRGRAGGSRRCTAPPSTRSRRCPCACWSRPAATPTRPSSALCRRTCAPSAGCGRTRSSRTRPRSSATAASARSARRSRWACRWSSSRCSPTSRSTRAASIDLDAGLVVEPGPTAAVELRTSVRRILHEPRFRDAAGRVADETRRLPTVDQAVDDVRWIAGRAGVAA